MESISMTGLAAFLSLLFTEGGKTLAVESVKLALEKRQDIKDGFVSLFKPEEIIQLKLNEEQSHAEVSALVEANPKVMAEIDERIKANTALVKKLEEFLSKQEGRTIHSKYYIENVEIGHFQ